MGYDARIVGLPGRPNKLLRGGVPLRRGSVFRAKRVESGLSAYHARILERTVEGFQGI